jgi:hypothetical protein
VRRIDSVLAAVDRGHREGVASAVSILLTLPAEVLPHRQAGRGHPCRVQLRLERLERREPLESDLNTEPVPLAHWAPPNSSKL